MLGSLGPQKIHNRIKDAARVNKFDPSDKKLEHTVTDGSSLWAMGILFACSYTTSLLPCLTCGVVCKELFNQDRWRLIAVPDCQEQVIQCWLVVVSLVTLLVYYFSLNEGFSTLEV